MIGDFSGVTRPRPNSPNLTTGSGRPRAFSVRPDLREAGKIQITATGVGLIPAQLEINSREAAVDVHP
jgi:hypothetical protein